jgi:hypothetical protein
MMDAFMCAGEFPSRWRYAAFQGMTLFKTIRISAFTLGSALSLMVTAAVVCGTYSIQTPLSIPEFRTSVCISEVMSINSVCDRVLTL